MRGVAGRLRGECRGAAAHLPRGLAPLSGALAATALLGLLPVAPAAAQDTGRAAAGAELQAAVRTLERGAYDEALTVLDRLASDGGAPAGAHRARVRALLAVGRYGDAEAAARRGVEATGDPALRTLLGEVLLRTGDLDGAARAFEAAAAGDGDAALEGRVHRAVLRFRRGEREEAMAAFDSFIDVYNRSRGLSARALTAVGTAVRHLGRTNPDLFQDALRAYDEAVAADSSAAEPRIRLGELFLEKYNGREARPPFRAVLDRNPNHPVALLGLARVMAFDGEAGAAQTARRALEINPELVPARVFLARQALETGGWEEARRQAERALETNPASLEALSTLVALHALRDDTTAMRRARSRALELYPGNPTPPLTAAELLATHRRYDEAVAFARDAVEADDRAWQAVGTLGLNLLRTGRMEEGRQHLERAFEGDPYNVWFKNTLDLLDTFAEYETRTTAHFRILIHGDESGVLGPYVEAVAEEAYRALTQRYGYEPPTPIRVEVFPSHADFSVRTVGLTGIGALGVSFGKVVILDSPSARDPASFNWASALWHEVAHSVHMGLSRHRVPRWFSEGLAVQDQRRGGAGWGHGAGTAFLSAYRAGRMPPASRLNEGFMRPDFPGQVVLSYYQASLVFRMIEEEWGFEAVRELLAGYGRGAETGPLLERVLGVDADALDARFDDYVRERFRRPMEGLPSSDRGAGHGGASRVDEAHAGAGRASEDELRARLDGTPDDFPARLALGRLLREDGELEAAAGQMEAALEIFPAYAGNDGPHWELARIRREQGRPGRAVEHLARLRALNESHLPGALMEAELRRELDDAAGAAAALERAVEIAPFEAEVHRRLAEVYAGLERWDAAVREREVLVALDPVDRTRALYELARARLAGGDRAGAREAVLRALERAPRFQEALELLLEIRGDEPGSGS